MAESKLYRISGTNMNAVQKDGHTELTGRSGKVLDLAYGGQFGWSPRLGRLDGAKHFSEWISNQAYVSRNIIAIVLQYPKAFDHLPDSAKWIATYKALMETQAEAITGFQAGLTLSVEEHAVGGGGEQQLEVTDSKRARTEVTYKWRERIGMPISSFLEVYMDYTIMNHETKTALIGLLKEFETDLYTADYYTGTVLFIEPDITHRQAVKAWLTTNLFPQTNGDITAKADKNQPGEMLEIESNHGGISVYNKAVLEFADKILAKFNEYAVDPNKATLFVDPDNAIDPVLSDITEVGAFKNAKVDE